jgi:hypothetical protein
MGKATESIFSGQSAIIPMADVQHIENWAANSIPGIKVITKHTTWDMAGDTWANAIWLSEPEATAFKAAWCRYRSEIESETLANLEPDLPANEYVRDNAQFGVGA